MEGNSIPCEGNRGGKLGFGQECICHELWVCNNNIKKNQTTTKTNKRG